MSVLRARPTLPALAVAACAAAIAAAPRTAAAQRHAAVRPVAEYRLTSARDVGMSAQVTVADSAGDLVARVRLAGETAARPMTVAVIDTDLVLQGETPNGVLTLLLERQNDRDAAGPLAGRWWLGDARGSLRGRR